MKRSSMSETGLLALALLATGFVTGCLENKSDTPAADNSPDPNSQTPATQVPNTTPSPTPSPTVQGEVSVVPADASISTLQTQQFTATVANSQNSAVTWQVDGIPSGNADVGVISPDGLYTSPSHDGVHTITATSVEYPTKSANAAVTVKFIPDTSSNYDGMLTYHNDNARTGQNLHEKLLTPKNVKTGTFGKLFSFPVDGAVYAQPLYVSNVAIGGRSYNVIYVATEHNSVYAFDAENQAGGPLWHVSFIDPANGITTVPSSDTKCEDINPEIGITSTPVIDPATGLLYVVAMTKENGSHVHRIHALDIATGIEKIGAGTKIQASVPGSAPPNDGKGHVVFTSVLENQRAALLLNNNVIYFSTGSFCDIGDHHGWLFAYDAKNLNLVNAFNVTPNGEEGGIWQSGGGAAADANGNIYVVTADGSFNADTGGNNYGSTFLKFSNASLVVSDYFTPFNQATLAAVNGDLGSGGALLLPDQASGPPHLLVGAGKQGTIYVLDRDNMGKYQSGSDSQIVQSLPSTNAMFGTPAYFNNNVYMAAVGDKMKMYAINNGQLALARQSDNTFRWPGATPAISANGSNDGIVWALETNGSGAAAVLHAYSASDVTEIYNSNQNTERDYPGAAVKFTVPVVANGRVYVGAQGQVSVFGLLP